MTFKYGMQMENSFITIVKSQLTRPWGADLLQGGSAQLDGDVSEEAVSLCAEISDDVRVSVRLSEELHLTLCYLETLRQYSLHRYVASIKMTPIAPKKKRAITYYAQYCMWFGTIWFISQVLYD